VAFYDRYYSTLTVDTTQYCISSWSFMVLAIIASYYEGDHSPDDVKFPDNSMTLPWRFVALLPLVLLISCWY